MALASSNNKRVAKNTIFLYIRMLVVMATAFYTSRVILESLGIDDYGVLNVVGGIAFSFGFFSSSMTNATQRYLSFGHGKGGIEKVKEYFNLITILFLIGSGAILVIGAATGFWIVSILNIPHNLYWSGVIVFYTTLVSLVITLMASVFDSVLVAREQMSIYAYLSILEAALKLGIAFLIFTTPTHKLVIYSFLLLGVTILVKGTLMIYCLKKFEECKFNLKWNKEQLKEICGFIGWNGLGTLVWVINEQGINILLNLFFGPILNAARGIANQVNSAINNFISNFFLALNPQIIKRYAAEDYSGCINMMGKSSLFSYCLLWLLCLPVMLRRDYILGIWLKEVPENTSIFLFWILIYSLVNVLTRPQWTVIQAVGNLKEYIINGAVTMIGAMPIAYLLFKFGAVPQCIFVVMIVLRALYVFVSIRTIRKYITFKVADYFTKVFLPIIVVTALSYTVMYPINKVIPENFGGLIMVALISFIITCILSLVSLDKATRSYLLATIKTKIKK